MKHVFRNLSGHGWMAVAIACGVLAALFIGLLVARPTKKESVKIGAVIALSGPAAHLVAVRDGMVLAADEINSRGGINGRPLELIIEDSKTDPEAAKEAFRRIEAEHHPELYVSTSSAVSMALAPLAEESQVVLVGLVVAAQKFTLGREWVFRYFTTAAYEVEGVIPMLQKLRIEKLGIFYLDDAYGLSVRNLLAKELGNKGGAVRDEPFSSEETLFHEKIEKLKDMDAIYVVGYATHFSSIFKQLKDANYSGFVLASSGAASSQVAGTPQADGVYVAAPIVYDPDYLFAKEAAQKYDSRYHKPFTHQAACGYDFVRLLTSLLRDKEISRANIKNLLEGGFIYPGVFGEVIAQPGMHEMNFPLCPARIVDGAIQYRR